MKRQLRALIITIELLMITTSIAYFNEALIVKAQADPQIVIEPDSYMAMRVGENFNIDVNIYDVEAIDRVVGIQFRVQYNATLLEALNVSEGVFMQQFNNTVVPPYTFFTQQIEDDPIQIMDVGRRWETDDGIHILVMDYHHQTYHLFFQILDLSWYLVRDIKPPAEIS